MLAEEKNPPAGLGGLDHLPSILFNDIGNMGICYAMWDPEECNGLIHYCGYLRAFPHVCQCNRVDHR